MNDARIPLGALAVLFGILCVMWPALPKSWGAWALVGRIFGASDDPSMGIQYMFFWMFTVLVGGFISGLGADLITGRPGLATAVGFVVVIGGVKVLSWLVSKGRIS